MLVPEKTGSIAKGAWPLLMSNMYSIQFWGVHSLASRPHSRLRALTLVEGAWTSLHALYMAVERRQINDYHIGYLQDFIQQLVTVL